LDAETAIQEESEAALQEVVEAAFREAFGEEAEAALQEAEEEDLELRFAKLAAESFYEVDPNTAAGSTPSTPPLESQTEKVPNVPALDSSISMKLNERFAKLAAESFYEADLKIPEPESRPVGIAEEPLSLLQSEEKSEGNKEETRAIEVEDEEMTEDEAESEETEEEPEKPGRRKTVTDGRVSLPPIILPLSVKAEKALREVFSITTFGRSWFGLLFVLSSVLSVPLLIHFSTLILRYPIATIRYFDQRIPSPLVLLISFIFSIIHYVPLSATFISLLHTELRFALCHKYVLPTFRLHLLTVRPILHYKIYAFNNNL
jgi:hypothetical protein